MSQTWTPGCGCVIVENYDAKADSFTVIRADSVCAQHASLSKDLNGLKTQIISDQQAAVKPEVAAKIYNLVDQATGVSIEVQVISGS